VGFAEEEEVEEVKEEGEGEEASLNTTRVIAVGAHAVQEEDEGREALSRTAEVAAEAGVDVAASRRDHLKPSSTGTLHHFSS
jgi:hypothetical protein